MVQLNQKNISKIKAIILSIFVFLLLPTCFSLSLFSQDILPFYSIKNIKVNTKYSDYGAAFFGPNRVFFSSNVKDAKSNFKLEKLNETYEAPNFDLFKGIALQTGELDYVEKIEISSSLKYNKSNASFSPDMKHVYFTQNNIIKGNKTISDKDGNVNLKIFRADVKSNGEWVNYVSMPFNSDDYSCTHPSVSEDNKLLFFASDMPGSYGLSDIYWVAINEDGTYGNPQNLGSGVNTEMKENFPYVDKNRLYFSSNRKGSMGGLDVYMIRLDSPGSLPINLGLPINSKQDDFCFVIERQNKKGYFSSNRPGGKGGDDIYYFTQESDFQDCVQTISGVVLDSETKKPIPGAIVSMYSHEYILLASNPAGNDGSYSFELACRGNYKVEASHFGYNQTDKEIFFQPNVFKQEIILYLNPKRNIVEVKVESKAKEIVDKEPIKKEKDLPVIFKDKREILDLPPVYFDLDQYYITKEAEKIINQAIDILLQNPTISIEFESHTDCRASDSYNLHLSDLRAKEVIQYMIKHGVDSNRLIGRGYGESKPVNHCIDGVKCSEPEHLQNRRAEFVIIRK